jgi:iron complex outermembrane receptor protein
MMRDERKAGRAFLLAAIGGMGLLAGSVPRVADAAEGTSEDQLEQVVVVAQRREELAQSVPLSVVAITADALQANVVQTGLDLQALVPSMSTVYGTQANAASYALRGIKDGVLTYFDEVPGIVTQTGASGVDHQLFDLASVQAISGPQGTLFGRASTGGAILFVPQKPTKDFEGSIDVGAGNYSRYESTAVLNLPLTETLQARIGGQIIRREGVVENTEGNDLQSQRRDSFRFSLLFTPVEWLTNYTLFDGGDTNEAPFAAITTGYVNAPCPTSLFACFYGTLPARLQALQNALGIREVADDLPPVAVSQDHERGVEDVLTADLGAYTLKYIFGYRSSRSYSLANQISFDIPAIYGQGSNISSQRTDELQLSGSDFGNRLKWVTGLFFYDFHSDNLNAFQILAPLGSPPFNLDNAEGSPGLALNKSKAAYAQGTYDFTDALGLTLGARYTQDDQSAVSSAFAPPDEICILNPTIPGVDFATCTQPQSARFHAVTYNATVDYKLSSDKLVYFATRKGYNPGGFNQGVAPSISSYDPEYLTDYEIGLKADWRIGAVPARTNLSAFFGKYTNIQLQGNRLVDTPAGPQAFSGIFNAASATIYGSQFDFEVRPLEWLTFTGNYGYLHSRYDSFVANEVIGNAAGNAFAQAPEHTANLAANLTQPLPFGELVGTVSYYHTSKITFSASNFNRPVAFQSPYGLLNARLELKNIAGSRVDVGIWGKNLTNKDYAVNIDDEPAFGFTATLYGDPRTYGMDVKYSFGGKQ